MEASLDTAQLPPAYIRSLDQVKALHRYAQAHKGKPREPKDVPTLVARHRAGIDFAKQQPHQSLTNSNTMLAVVVGEPYPPSTKCVNDLEQITFAQLRTETHHTGKVLLVRRILGLILARTTTGALVADPTGTPEILKLAHGDTSLGDEGLLPTNVVLAIKEPYYTFNGEKAGELRVDHPSDIMFLRPTDPRLAEIKTARELKEAGNAALKQKHYVEAVDCYSQGLNEVSAEDKNIQCDLYRNRSHVNLLLERYEAAQADALAALLGNEEVQSKLVDCKAYFRAGSAAYHLRNFNEAHALFGKQLQLVPTDKDGKLMLQKTKTRLRERERGGYEFSLLTSKLSKATARVDAADFTNKTEIKQSAGRGRGLFATVDLKPGELILCEKAYCVLFEHEEQHFKAMKLDIRSGNLTQGTSAIWKELVNKLYRNPSSAKNVMALHSGGYPDLGTAQTVVDGLPIIDTFHVHDIVVRNAYGCPTPTKEQAETEFGFNSRSGDHNSGIWVHASYINHACVSNAHRTFIGDLVLFRALKPIAKGEEITTAYTQIPDYAERQKTFAEHWGFQCGCLLCTAEGEDSPAERRNRKKLEEKAAAFLRRHRLPGAPVPSPATRVRDEGLKLAQSITATYDAGRYHGVPRNAALSILAWLVQAYHDRRDTTGCLAAMTEYFKLLAYDQVTIDEKKRQVTLRPGKGSMLNEEAVQAVLYASNLMLETGKREMALKLDAAAREFYLIVNGVMNGYVGIPAQMLQ